MVQQRFVVMGAGEVGFHLARSLSAAGHHVTVIELDDTKVARVDDELDVLAISGNGAHPPVLESAGVADCDVFIAASSSEEANLTASVLAKHLGAKRTVARVTVAEEVITYREMYEEVFGIDLMLSTQLLTTIQVLNRIRGHNTVAVEYLAAGKIQLRKVHLTADSPLAQSPLRDVQIPADSLVVAYLRGKELVIPSGDDRAEPGDDALILGTTDVIAKTERLMCGVPPAIGTVVIAGAGVTGRTIAKALEPVNILVKIIERDGKRAGKVASMFPNYEIIQGDVTDISLMKAERVGQAKTFVALTGNDESNLLACLLAQELQVPHVLALVQRTETSQLWRRLGLEQVFSPRALAYKRIREYIESGFSAHLVSLQNGKAQVLERRIESASPTAGATLAEIKPPRGLIVGAVARGEKVFVPRGKDRLEIDDTVILFVSEEELDTVQLFFPGPPAD